MRRTVLAGAAVVLLFCLSCFGAAQEPPSVLVTGLVVDGQARPIAGVEVVAYEQEYRDGERIAKVVHPAMKTDQAGTFEMRLATDNQRGTLVVVRKPGMALAWDILNDYRCTKSQVHLPFVLQKPCTLTGTVVNRQGRPVVGATVQAAPKTSYMSRLRQRPIIAPAAWFTAETDDNGVFHFDIFEADVSCDFWVEAFPWKCTYQFTTHNQPACGFEVWRRDIRLVLPDESPVRGRAVEAATGKPVGGLELTIGLGGDRENIENRYVARTVVTDTDGAFVCDGLPEGPHKISLASMEAGVASWVAVPVDVNVVSGRPTEGIEIAVEKGAQIAFTVRDRKTEQCLPKMRVSVYGENGSGRAQTDEKGQTTIRVLPGEYQAYASGPSYDRWTLNEPVIAEEGKTHEVDVALDCSLSVESPVQGTVLNADGQPVEDVTVVVHPFGDHVYTDRQGRFTAGYDERYVEQGLCIMARDRRSGQAAIVFTQEPEEAVRVSLGPALMVTGRITGPGGAGIPAARVSLCANLPRCLSQMGEEVLTDAQGRFEFRAIPAQEEPLGYRISVHASAYVPQTYNRTSIEGEPGTTLDIGAIEMGLADLSVSGVVVRADGTPAAHVPIFVNQMVGVDQPDKSTATDAQGRFAITRLGPGPIRLQANFSSSPGGSGFLKAQAGDQGLKIVLGQTLVHERHGSLLGAALPDLSEFGIAPSDVEAEGKAILVCCFDMQHRPSRHGLLQLAKRAESLRERGLTVVAVQASAIEVHQIEEWITKNHVPFPVRIVPGDAEKTKLTWGIKSLPWLILTDAEHVVRAEGFGLDALEAEVKRVAGR